MRIYLDNTNMTDQTVFKLDGLLERGNNKLVVDETAVDIAAFQDNLTWTQALLEEGSLQVEQISSLDKLTSERFFWFSRGVETSPCETFDRAIEKLQDAYQIKQLSNLLTLYSTNWIPAPIVPPPLTIEESERIGVAGRASQTEVYLAALRMGRLWIFRHHNDLVISTLAKLHNCNAYLDESGKIKKVESRK